MKLFLLANVNRLAIVTLRTVEVIPPVYTMTFDAAYDHCIRFQPPLFSAMRRLVVGTLDSVNSIQIFCCFFGVNFGI